MSLLTSLASAAPAIGTAIAPGLGTVGGAIVSGIAGSVSKYADQQNAQQLWNKTNEYNSPSAQVARLKKAGLNPNFILGNGGVSGNAQSQPSTVITNDSSTQNKSIDAAASVMNMMAQADLYRAQAAFTEANKTKLIDYDMPNTAADTEFINANIKRTEADTSLTNLQAEAQDWTNKVNFMLQEPKMRAEIENISSQTVNNIEQRKLIQSNVKLVAQQVLETAARAANIKMDTAQMQKLLPLIAGKLSADTALVNANTTSTALSNQNEFDILKFNRTPANKKVPNTNRNYNLINMLRTNASNAKAAGVNADWSNFNQYWNKATDVSNSVSQLGGAAANFKNVQNNAHNGEVRNDLFRQQLNRTTVTN